MHSVPFVWALRPESILCAINVEKLRNTRRNQ